MPGIARLNAGVVRIGRQLAKRRNIMWRLEFDLSLEQNSPDQPEKRVQNGRSATRLNVASRFELPLLGSNQDSPDPESVLRHDLNRVVPASNSTMCRCLYSLLNVFREIVYDRHNEMRHNEM